MAPQLHRNMNTHISCNFGVKITPLRLAKFSTYLFRQSRSITLSIYEHVDNDNNLPLTSDLVEPCCAKLIHRYNTPPCYKSLVLKRNSHSMTKRRHSLKKYSNCAPPHNAYFDLGRFHTCFDIKSLLSHIFCIFFRFSCFISYLLLSHAS